MCFKSNLKKITTIIVNNRSICAIGEDPDVPEPSKYHQNVWLFS